MTRKQYIITILILGALSTIGPFSIDMYLPGFQAIARDLHTTVDKIQLSLTSYFIGISIGQLLYGPLLDRFGRKAPLYAGMGLYILTSFSCAWVNSVTTLIIMRFFQAVGGCVCLVASRALVRDLFPVKEIAKIFSLLMLVIAVSPLLAPTLGGYFAANLGWHYIFITLGAIGILILLTAVFALPAGRPADPDFSLKPRPIVNSFLTVLKNRTFLVYAFTSSIAASVTYTYIAGSPDVFMNVYKADPKLYGWIFAIVATAIIGSSQLNSLALRRFSSEQLISTALIWQITWGIVIVLAARFNWFNIYEMIAAIFLFMCGQGFTVPNASALALTPFARLAGSASALLGALQLGIGSLASLAVSVLHNGTAMPMVVTMLGCVILALLVQIRRPSTIPVKEEELALL